MKRIAIVMFTCLFIVSCSSDDDKNVPDSPDLMGSWKLIETYADPGDGSGDFVAVESDKTVTFLADGTVTSNGNLCLAFSDAGDPSSGTYSLEDSIISIGTCGIVESQLTFEIVNENLILGYLCIEPCLEKYIKVN